jgi:hypothetical protein
VVEAEMGRIGLRPIREAPRRHHTAPVPAPRTTRIGVAPPPAATRLRIAGLDVLRGFALCGVGIAAAILTA